MEALIAISVLAAAPTDGRGTDGKASNPILWADVPDPCILRVGDTYYLSSTTMHLSPGLPIMKSRDLVHWTLAGYAYETLADTDALNLLNGKNAYGQGSWASSLRYHEGTYIATTFSHLTGKTHVYRTRDIEKGPWTATAFQPALHDHSLWFEDGRAFMIHGSHDIRITELVPDLSGIKPGGLDRVIVPEASLVAGTPVGLPAEGSQIHKIRGRYYLFLIAWPKGGMRTALVFRSDRLTGPYEGRIALRDAGIAQGGLVDTPGGAWYALFFQDRGAVGRVPHLVPVTWQDGWPVLGIQGRVPETLDLPPSPGMPGIVASDEFDYAPDYAPGKKTPLCPVWQWNHNPDPRGWSVTRRRGFLTLIAGRVADDLLSARNTLTQRTFGPACSGRIALDVGDLKDGDVAGLAVLQKHYGFIGVSRTGDAKAVIAVEAGSGTPRETERIPLPADRSTVFLRIDCDFRNRADRARFYWSLDGSSWTAAGPPHRMVYTIPHFMGYRFALFHYATKTPGGMAHFDHFRLAGGRNPLETPDR